MHRHPVAGLREGWDYYPALIEVMAADLELLGHKGIKKDDIEQRLHDLDEADGILGAALAVGNYYNAVSHTTSSTGCSRTSPRTRTRSRATR